MKTTPSVRVEIWCEGSVHYAHTTLNANPHDQKLHYMRQMRFWSRVINPWLEVYHAVDNKSYLIKKSKVLIMEFKWVDNDD